MDQLTLRRAIQLALDTHHGPGPIVISCDLPAVAIVAIWTGTPAAGRWVLLADPRADPAAVARHRAAYELLQAAGISSWNDPLPPRDPPPPCTAATWHQLVAGAAALWAATPDEVFVAACISVL